MRICYVVPRSPGWLGGVHRSGKAGLPRISLCQLAATTPVGHSERLVDTRFGDPNFDDDSDLVAITAFTGEAPHAYRLAEQYRRHGKQVVMGGIHASMLPEEALEHVDSVVVGEAETIWPQVVSDAERGELKRIYRAQSFHDLEGLPVARRDLLDQPRYFTSSVIQATRGCPFDCIFCSVTAFSGRKVRRRPVAEVVAEVAALPDRRSVMFLDDNIAINPSYAAELFTALKPLKIRWSSQASINCTEDTELMQLMRDSGCDFLLIGLESVNQESLEAASKGRRTTIQRNADAIRALHEHGINILGSFVVGLDGDDLGVFRSTYEFIQQHSVDTPIINILTPYPGTVLYRQLQEEGRIFDPDWGNFYNSNVTFYPRQMTPHQLLDGYFWLVRKLYSPAAMARRAFKAKRNLLSRLSINISNMRKAGRLPSVAHADLGSGPSRDRLPGHVIAEAWGEKRPTRETKP